MLNAEVFGGHYPTRKQQCNKKLVETSASLLLVLLHPPLVSFCFIHFALSTRRWKFCLGDQVSGVRGHVALHPGRLAGVFQPECQTGSSSCRHKLFTGHVCAQRQGVGYVAALTGASLLGSWLS